MDTVFVSYAREDRKQAREIYLQLVKAGFSAWIDETELAGGENWEVRIRDTISSSRVFLACLSSRAVSKRGYVQAELKQALKVLELVPEEFVFIIPVRLDPCTVPRSLATFHSVDYFERNGRSQLLKAVARQIPKAAAPSANEGGPLAFAVIRIDLNDTEWEEVPDDLDRNPFAQTYRSLYKLHDPLSLSAEPLFDVTAVNRSGQPLILSEVGVEIVKVAQVAYKYGRSHVSDIVMTHSFSLEMPDLLAALRRTKKHLDKPVVVDRIVSCRSKHPILIDEAGPIRYGLKLGKYVERMPNHAVLRLWARTDAGEARSDEFRMFTR
jgi:TIR domain